ncbi:MAG: hypothetical protein UT41_C0001G0568 [Candidatus Wolfebacteria bacterium GW2011_GWC2_39_22]|uniref:Uncharacterized protein n=1 Tax=Candidatus Wolfebacteria bacterium GW2011_GWC2_39_22 TaxID=1619013 RepID=A0A0G0NA03_9BACT|nr:MAG: hypothetical protein UT41_C0001G0568 [Candidatus Wolfebacteria bacterium GW2011_GWC2_39_22]HBI25326.1 hypothetical protein [Candidatus Wolfebacteria bacterium]
MENFFKPTKVTWIVIVAIIAVYIAEFFIQDITLSNGIGGIPIKSPFVAMLVDISRIWGFIIIAPGIALIGGCGITWDIGICGFGIATTLYEIAVFYIIASFASLMWYRIKNKKTINTDSVSGTE